MKKLIAICLLSFNFNIGIQAQEKLAINIDASSIHWYGYYTFYFGGHDGTVDFAEGYFLKNGNMITGGKFVIDMTSLISTDLENAKANKSLTDHLKDPDFFDVAKYPTAKLVITKVTYGDPTHMKIEADLTIKGKTEPINFPAEVNFVTQQMTAKFKIDRMRWGVSYNSTLRDGAISDAIGFEVTIAL
jgi:polyisoprenoid-binding protein YceI